MNGKEQAAHKTVTHALDRRTSDLEALFIKLDERQVELTRAVADDIVRLQQAGENSYALAQEGITSIQGQLNILRADHERLEAYIMRTWWQRLRDWVRSWRPLVTTP